MSRLRQRAERRGEVGYNDPMNDESFMAQALKLAENGRGRVHPNPMVGAVVVKNGRVVGKGFHARFGGPHAEINALKQAGRNAQGATLYLNLEPCSHWGKTPPCVDAVIGSGIKRVVAAMQDPNPQVAGKGFAALRRAGIRVTKGICESDAQVLNRAFTVWIRERRPYVTLKIAASLDGRIATSRGESQWITNAQSRKIGHTLRAEADAIAVGVNTVLRDRPSLGAHGAGRDPIRIIFDSALRGKTLESGAPTRIVTTSRPSAAKEKRFEKNGARVLRVDRDPQGRVKLASAMRRLAEAGIAHLLVEGGGELHASFLKEHLADEIYWFAAPLIIGGRHSLPAVGGEDFRRLSDAYRLEHVRIERIGDDFYFHGVVKR